MENFISTLLLQNECSLEESTLLNKSGSSYWHSTILNKSRTPLSGGFADDRMQARKIAVAEFLEREAFQKIFLSDESTRQAWGIDIINTACGFAAGFNLANTINRSINESVERWVMSKWIDDNLEIEELSFDSIKTILDPASLFFISYFEKVMFFKKTVVLFINSKPVKISVAQTMGLTSHGIYPGSSAQISGNNIWHHALLESFRHFLFVKNNPASKNNFPDNKIRFFSMNKDIAIKQICGKKQSAWPIPQITLHNSKSYLEEKYFIARTIIAGWKPWNEGPIERFLY
jgi:hypothetical protein